MVTRESTLRESFDPAAFHRIATIAQTGWADREVTKASGGLGATAARFSGSITFVLGLLMVLALRPPNIMDGRDVFVSGVAIAGCTLVGMIVARIVMAFFRTSPQVDRIVIWASALVAASIIAGIGSVAAFARDADDYIADIPGYTLTQSIDADTYGLVTDARRGMRDVGVWTIEGDQEIVGAVGVYLMPDVNARGTARAMASATTASPAEVQRRMIDNESVMAVTSSNGIKFGWFHDGALVVVAGANRAAIEPTAAALLHARER